MKFFIPAAKSAEQAEQVYDGIKAFLREELGAQFSERRIRALRWTHDGKKHEAEVGKATTFNGELTVAILYEPRRDLYHVCTPNRGVVCGMSILAGATSVAEVSDFQDS